MHDIERWLDGKSEAPETDTSTLITQLEELAAWQPVDGNQWCGSDSWQWQDTIRELRYKVARSRAVTSPGEPAS